MHDKITILLSGAPATGKSTIQWLAPAFFRARLGEAAAFGTDEIYRIVDPNWSLNSERLRQICKENCIRLALNLFQHGIQDILIAGNALYDKDDVNDYIEALAPVSSIYHFTLETESEALAERVRMRGDGEAHPQAWLDSWLELVQRHAGAWTHVIDTTELAPNDALEHMLAGIMHQDGKLSQRIS